MIRSKAVSLSRRAERGVAILVTAALLGIMVPVVGLSIDAVILYSLKARLSTAADAAAIAAARSLNVGLTLAQQEDSARQRAGDFFRANFPPQAWNTSNHSTAIDVAESGFRTRTVTVDAAVDAPQYFMRWLGFRSTRIRAMGRASRRDVNLILVLDRSGSMGSVTNPASPCAVMRSSSITFTNMFAEGRDRLGFVAFGSGFRVGFNPSMNFKSGGTGSMTGQLGTLSCGGGTSTPIAYWQAYQLIRTINEPGALNLIVLFTDGWPNGIAADLPYRTVTDSRFGGVRQDTTTTRNINTRYPASYPNTATTYSMPPSPCRLGNTGTPPYHYYNMRCNNASCSSFTNFPAPGWNPSFTPGTRRGVVTQSAGDQDSLNTGSTVGPILIEEPSLTHAGTTIISGLDDCAANTSANWASMRRDVAFLPDTDIYGNSTRGYMPFTSGTMTYPTGHPHQGRLRIDVPRVMTRAGLNTADNAAARTREDTTLSPLTYVIGLGDVNHEINRRMANDPTSPIFDTSKPEGMYIYAATPTELNQAFARVASEILRLAL